MHPIAVNLLEVIRANMPQGEWRALSQSIYDEADCHTGVEDGCEHCDLYQTMKNLT